MKALLAGLCLAASAAGAQSTAECDRGGLLSPAGIGPLKVGMTADSMARVCRVISSGWVSEYAITMHAVRVGADTVQVQERNGRVEYIEVRSPIHRTRDSIGVGTPVHRLLDLPDLESGAGDGTNTYAIIPRSGPLCGLVFWIDGETAEMINRAKGDGLRMLRMRGAGTIDSIDIHGACPSGRQ